MMNWCVAQRWYIHPWNVGNQMRGRPEKGVMRPRGRHIFSAEAAVGFTCPASSPGWSPSIPAVCVSAYRGREWGILVIWVLTRFQRPLSSPLKSSLRSWNHSLRPWEHLILPLCVVVRKWGPTKKWPPHQELALEGETGWEGPGQGRRAPELRTAPSLRYHCPWSTRLPGRFFPWVFLRRAESEFRLLNLELERQIWKLKDSY